MKLFIFLIFLAIAYGHHGDPDLHEDQNCSQKCQDQCFPCENLCREQTLSSSQKDCQACQRQCQQCLTMCHNGGSENEVIVDSKIQSIPNFLSVDRCNMCKTQCSTCKLKCHFGYDCEDCEQICERCNDFCHSRSKRHDDEQKQPVPSCQEKCASLCMHGKSEDCENCLGECEGDQGGQEGHGQDKSQQDDGRGDQQLIPLGSCRECMNYCNLCEVQCKNSRLGQPKCDRCHERCSKCREMCSPESSLKQDQDKPYCQGQCRNVCADRQSLACKNCLSQCQGGQNQTGQDNQNGSGQEQDTQLLAPFGSCRKCMNYCNLCKVQCQSSKLGQLNCDRCNEICSQCGEMCSSGSRSKRDMGNPTCQDQCRHSCSIGKNQACQDCMKQCEQGDGQEQLNEQGGEQIEDHGQLPISQDCQRCRKLCAHGTGKHCSDCLSRCHGVEQIQPEGQADGHEQQPDSEYCQQCQHLCARGQGKFCHDCFERCTGHDQSGGQKSGKDGQGDQEQQSDFQICKECQQICAHGLNQRCQDCLTHCDQGNGYEQDEQVQSDGQGDNGHHENLIDSDCQQRCDLICRGTRQQSKECQKCWQQCEQQQGPQNEQDGSLGDGQEDQGHHQDCLQKCQGVCTSRRGISLEGCQYCLNQCQQGHQSGQQQGRHNPRCQACKLGCNFCFTHCQSQGDKNCEHCRSSCSGCKEICQEQQDHGTREKRNTGKCEEMCQGVCRRDPQEQGCQQCLQNCRNDEHLGHGDSQPIGLKHGQNPECRERCQAVCQKDQGQSQGQSTKKVEKSPECKECFAQCRQESNGEGQKEGQDQDKSGCRAECRQICAKFGHGQQCRECFSNCRQEGKDGQEQDLAGQQNCTDCTKQCRACIAHNHHLCSGDDHEQIAECVECRETCRKCRDPCK
uniref:Uncharacterized protein n=1 Tax=Acrobeloides nanus TaxID=290746 RepID=A0A914EB36_9BILA